MVFPDDTKNSKELILALFAEHLATMMYVFMGCLSVVATADVVTGTNGANGSDAVARVMPISMAFGMSMMVLVYAVGALSGGHVNPAVSFFLCMIQQMSPLRMALYVLAQTSGAVLGAALVMGSTSGLSDGSEGVSITPYSLGATTLNKELTSGNGFLLECMGTLFVIFVFFSTAVRPGGPADGQPNLAPLCIGFAVLTSHLALTPFTGCGINPARALGPSLVDSFAGHSDGWETNSWIYYVGPFSASIVAAALYYLLSQTDDLPHGWDADTGDAQVETSCLDVRKYRKPSSVATTGFVSSQAKRMRLVKSSAKLKGSQMRVIPQPRQQIVVTAVSTHDIEAGKSPSVNKFSADQDPTEKEDQRNGVFSHKFPPTKPATTSKQAKADNALSHKFPPVNVTAKNRTPEPGSELDSPLSCEFSFEKDSVNETPTPEPERDAALSHKFPPTGTKASKPAAKAEVGGDDDVSPPTAERFTASPAAKIPKPKTLPPVQLGRSDDHANSHKFPPK